MLGAGAQGRPRGMVWGGRREEGSGWGTHVYLWWIHFDIWQNQYNIVKFKNKIKKKKKNKVRCFQFFVFQKWLSNGVASRQITEIIYWSLLDFWHVTKDKKKLIDDAVLAYCKHWYFKITGITSSFQCVFDLAHSFLWPHFFFSVSFLFLCTPSNFVYIPLVVFFFNCFFLNCASDFMCVRLVAQSCQTLWDPIYCSPPGSSVHVDSSGKNTGVGCHALLQGIFPTQGLNLSLPHCGQILYCLSHQRSPLIL